MLVTAVPLGLAAIGIARHAASAPRLLAAAAVVQLGLLVAVPYVRRRARDISEELIASGNGPARRLRVVEDELRRLESRREQERLAHSLELFIDDARRWPRRALPPPPGVVPMRSAVPEARQVVSLLRESARRARVALTSRLLTDGGASPLFGTEAEPLREELGGIRFLLAKPRDDHDERLAA